VRPIKLTIKGLNSFIEEQTIDFTHLASRGLFGIFGPTGSGKSTLLDGITLALYSKTARDSSDYINKNEESTYVLFEFQIREQETKHYRVERCFKRNDKGGINARKPTRIIELLPNGEEVVLEDMPTKVDKKCIEVVGLKFEDFIRTVVLPQGKFSEFLQLEGTSKREMLERIFSLSQYGEGLSRRLSSVIRKEKSEMDQLQGELKAYENVSEESLKAEEKELEEITSKLRTVEEALVEVTKTFQQSEEIYSLQKQKTFHEQGVEQLAKQAVEIENKKEKVAQGEKALKVKPYHIAFLRTKEQLQKQIEISKDQQLQKQRLQTEYELVIKKYEEKKAEKEEKLPALSVKIKEIEEAIEEKRLEEALEIEIKALRKAYKEKDIQRKDLVQKREQIEKETVDSNNKINILEGEIKKRTIEPTYRETLQRARVVQIQLEALYEQKQEMQKESAQLKEQLSGLGKQIETESVQQTKIINTLYQFKQGLDAKQTKLQREISEHKQALQLLAQKEQIKALREHIHKGDVCPVCNQEVLQELSKEAAIEKVHSEETEQALLIEMEDTCKNIERQLILLTTLLENKQSNLEAPAQNVSLEENENKQGDKFLFENKNLDKVIAELKIELEKSLNESIKLESSLYETGKRQELLQQKLSQLLQAEKKYVEQLTAFEKELGVKEFAQREAEIKQFDQQKKSYEQEILLLREQIKKADESIKTYSQQVEALSSELSGIYVKGQEKGEQIEQKKQAIFKKVGQCEDLQGYYIQTKEVLAHLQQSFAQLEEEKKYIEENYRQVEKRVDSLVEQIKALEERMEQEEELLDLNLQKQGFESLGQMEVFLVEEAAIEGYKLTIEKYTQEVHELKGKLQEVIQKLQGRRLDELEWENIQKLKNDVETQKSTLTSAQIEKKTLLTQLKEKTKEQKELRIKEEQKQHKLSILKDLEGLFKGKKFVEFVAIHQLKYISFEASKRLKDITSGNYGLELDESGKFIIRDYKNGGATRDATTLSGGETFLVSLSLALALSYHIQLKGNAPLELFFLDEGFGTLDEGLLEIVMSSIERLHHERLSVGIISHVESIKNRVPIRLTLTPSKSGMGGSKVSLENT
jgi:exonuclease SbcC